MLGNGFIILKKTQYEQQNMLSQPILDNSSIYYQIIRWFITPMSTESLNRTSDIDETPSQIIETSRVNVDVLKQRIIDQKKKDKFKRTIIFSTVCVSLGALTLLAN